MDGKAATVVVLTGAGVSAESGLKTFRDSNGLWEGYHVEDVATDTAWERNPGLVLQFYNERRRALLAAEPNAAHYALAGLEEKYDVRIITQNVDDLHERAGSTQILHLHGELRKARSTADERLVYELKGSELNIGDLCEKGSQLRPHIVWFGEAVPCMDEAIRIARKADIFVVIGTSLVVYPAASLIDYVSKEALKYLIDPKCPQVSGVERIEFIRRTAAVGVPELAARLLKQARTS